VIAPALGVLFDGFAYGMLLFLLSVGLSVTLGMMNFVNLAHGSFAMLGAYVTVTLMALGWPFLATLPAAFLITGVTSVAFERSLFRRLYRASDLQQVLLTLGLVFISVAAAAWCYGTMQQPIRLPAYLRTYATVVGINLSIYRLFLIAVALAVTVVLVAALEYKRFGAQVRAAVAAGLPVSVVRWRSTLSGLIRTLHSPT
jgi:branched-chain amino acid transport system permease protein